MAVDYYSLEVYKSNKLTRIFQLVFGIICAAVALIWLISNLNSLKSNWTLLITIFFLLGFAYYLVNSGLGYGEKFVEIGQNIIKLKKNSLFPSKELSAYGIERIEIFPLNLIFFLRSGKTVFLRFGTTYTDIINPVRTGIKTFCERNNIPLEFKNEEL